MRSVCARAIRIADATAPDELARAGAGARRSQSGSASLRATDWNQLGGIRWPASLHLLRLVWFRLPNGRESNRDSLVSVESRATPRACHQRSVRASRELRRK